MTQLQSVNENLNEYVSGVSGSQPASTLYHTLQRHNEILQDYKQEFNRIKVQEQLIQQYHNHQKFPPAE